MVKAENSKRQESKNDFYFEHEGALKEPNLATHVGLSVSMELITLKHHL